MTNKPSSAPAPSGEKAQSKASNNCACQLLSARDRDEPGLLITTSITPTGIRASPTFAFAACLGISDAASAAATIAVLAKLQLHLEGLLRRTTEAPMDSIRAEALRMELGQLLQKQTEVLESRTFGGTTDTDILEYEIRHEIIHKMCNELANSDATAWTTPESRPVFSTRHPPRELPFASA